TYGCEVVIYKTGLTEVEAIYLESYFIKLYSRSGILVNKSAGGNACTFSDRKHTDETKATIKKNASKFWTGKKLTVEMLQKISNSKKGRFMGADNHFAKAVLQYSKDGQFIKEWSCMKEASTAL